MNKIKGWKAEERIDKVLNKKFLKEAFGYERWQNPKHNEIKTALRQAKTLIMTLRDENKFLEKECKRESDDYETYYNKWLDTDCELRKLKNQNKEMFEQHQDYFVENEKLKQELADCVMSNELLDKENDRLKDELQDYKNCNEMLENENRDLTKINLNGVKLIAEFRQFGLDKELERLKQTEGFGNIWIPMEKAK